MVGILGLAGGPTSVVILGSIVVPLAVLSGLCWFFWKHRHDD